MKLDNYFKDEPSTYKKIYKESSNWEEYLNTINLKNIDSHSQINDAKLFADRLNIFISTVLKKKQLLFLDCGCGLGFIAREYKKISNNDVYYCDPSESINKLHKKFYPDENFFQSDIQNLKNFNDKFDIIYLREVYPFTRDDNLENQLKLIKILNHQLNNDGILIFEQIKNKNDLMNNLKKFNFNFKIYFLPPIRWQKFRFITKFSFTSFYFQLFIRLVYTILGKKITQFILIKKF